MNVKQTLAAIQDGQHHTGTQLPLVSGVLLRNERGKYRNE